MSKTRASVTISKERDFEKKLSIFLYHSQKILKHPKAKPEKRKLSYLKKQNQNKKIRR